MQLRRSQKSESVQKGGAARAEVNPQDEFRGVRSLLVAREGLQVDETLGGVARLL
ncbi:MAG: hypothetical protein WBB22_17760 [Anaerolineae bacterium]